MQGIPEGSETYPVTDPEEGLDLILRLDMEQEAEKSLLHDANV